MFSDLTSLRDQADEKKLVCKHWSYILLQCECVTCINNEFVFLPCAPRKGQITCTGKYQLDFLA